MTSPQEVLDSALALVRRWLDEDDGWEHVLARLRLEGFQVNVAVRVTQVVLGLSSHDSHERVIASEAWSDQRQALIDTQNALVDYLDERGEGGSLEIDL